MKKIIVVCLVFVAGVVMSSDVFAQRGVNNSQEAAKAARDSLSNRHGRSSSQIDWLNQAINVINMDQPDSKDSSSENKKSDKVN
ncbi:MAG: hypothetical protein Q7S30_01550 [Candidatus Omnitrophota bacterium]|nr:hypothetical protein [Candidatus Omnitrophota bacterium]